VTRPGSKNNSSSFRQNANTGKFPKYRFIPGIHRGQVAEKRGWPVLSPWVGAVMAGSNTLKQDNNNVEKL
jgi:hypothetical protein